MKKILLLGGSAQQVVAIETAKRLGLKTILCDYLTDNPGQYVADQFYLVSTTDREAVLAVAQAEKIDGVLAYASDPAAPTAAYVAEKMNLPGNPAASVDILCHKDQFRQFLRENHFHTPESCGYTSVEEAVRDCENGRYQFPVMVKPVDSSGSKGVVRLDDTADIEENLRYALSYSRTGKIIVEEYIEKAHPYLIGGDIFVNEGRVIQWGLMNCHRDPNVNPLVPVGKSYPILLDDVDLSNTKKTLQRMIDLLHIQSGALNVELIVDKNHEVWLIDIGPRSGGNMIPDLLGYIFGTNLPEMCVQAAMGLPLTITSAVPVPYYATHNLHTAQNGVFQCVAYAASLQKNIVRDCIYKKPGDIVEYFDDASKAIGIVFLKFDTMEEMLERMDHSEQWIQVKVET